MVNTNIIVGPDFLHCITVELIMDVISDVIGSNNYIPADKGLSINVAAIKNIEGLNRICVTNVWQDLVKKSCLISVENDDTLCLPRATAVAVARYNHVNNPGDIEMKRIYDSIRKKDRKRNYAYSNTSLQKQRAVQYQKMANIPLNKIGLLPDIPLYEKSLRIGITVVSARSGNKKVHNSNKSYPTQVALYHVEDDSGNGHFSVLTKMNALLVKSYYCNNCDIGYNNNDRHRCNDLCGRNKCLKETRIVSCKKCNAQCHSKECLYIHQQSQSNRYPSKCSQMFFCPDCKVSLKTMQSHKNRDLNNHICGESFYKNCNKYYLDDHLCYMCSTEVTDMYDGDTDMDIMEVLGYDTSNQPWCKHFIFYDFESIQDGTGEHIPNVVVAHSICDKCQDETHVKPTSTCSSYGSHCSLRDKLNEKGNNFDGPPCLLW